MTFHFNFGETLLLWRRRKGMSQEDAATHFYISTNTYARWEKGAAFPSIMDIPMLCRELGMSPNELFGVKESC